MSCVYIDAFISNYSIYQSSNSQNLVLCYEKDCKKKQYVRTVLFNEGVKQSVLFSV